MDFFLWHLEKKLSNFFPKVVNVVHLEIVITGAVVHLLLYKPTKCYESKQAYIKICNYALYDCS